MSDPSPIDSHRQVPSSISPAPPAGSKNQPRYSSSSHRISYRFASSTPRAIPYSIALALSSGSDAVMAPRKSCI